jgi:NAD(P)-dependent dehydrogenase (short-subunit alcohol dehydrogenase family)
MLTTAAPELPLPMFYASPIGHTPAMTKQTLPKQEQDTQPGSQEEMHPEPLTIRDDYVGSGKLDGARALITGGDSGIGRAVAALFAREGADIAISYLDESADAEETQRLVEREGRKCLLLPGDIGNVEHAEHLVTATVDAFGGLDILVNNAGEQHVAEELEDIEPDQLERTFQTNLFAAFHLAQAALEHLEASKFGGAIVNTASVVAFKGKPVLVDYAATKGAMVAFTRSLAGQVVDRGVRVNAVAPGPIWTPLIPASFDEEHVKSFGASTPMGRPGQPAEVAPAYVYLASKDASYVTGQVIHVNGGEIVGS